MFRKLMLAALAVVMMSSLASTPVFASDDHACKTDKDCGHGEHCKEGHCHK